MPAVQDIAELSQFQKRYHPQNKKNPKVDYRQYQRRKEMDSSGFSKPHSEYNSFEPKTPTPLIFVVQSFENVSCTFLNANVYPIEILYRGACLVDGGGCDQCAIGAAFFLSNSTRLDLSCVTQCLQRYLEESFSCCDWFTLKDLARHTSWVPSC